MRTARLLFAALVIALTATACSDVPTGPVAGDDCPWMGGGGTCRY